MQTENIQHFWGVQRPDGKLVPQTFSINRQVTEWNANRLCKRQHHMSWKLAKKKYGYHLVKLEAKVLYGVKRKTSLLDRFTNFIMSGHTPVNYVTYTVSNKK